MSSGTLLTLVSILAITVSALPNGSPSSSCTPFTDNNLATAPVGNTPVGVNNGITYQGFSGRAKSAVTGTTGSIIPHSGSQDVVFGIAQDVVQIGSVTLNPFGNILASPSKAFDLYSFWFGCSAALAQPEASVSVACVLSVIGFTATGKELPVTTFSFSPDSPTAAPMVLALLPDYYRGLKNVTLGVAASTTTPTVTGTWLDDVTHCNYY